MRKYSCRRTGQCIAFAGRVTTGGGVTAVNDEGVWVDRGLPPLDPVVIQETTQLGKNYGNTGLLHPSSAAAMPAVANLQASTEGRAVCQVSTNTVGGLAGVIANATTQVQLGRTLAGAGSLVARHAPITNLAGTVVAEREHRPGLTPQVVEYTGFPAGPLTASPPLWPLQSLAGNLLGANTWLLGQGTVTRPGSPSMDRWGQEVFYGIDNNLPAYSRPMLYAHSWGGPMAIVRQGDACPPNPMVGVLNFGVIAAPLMAVEGGFVAWQMANMRSGPLPGSVLASTNCLWAREGTQFGLIAYENQPAPFLAAGTTFSSFYALHATRALTSNGVYVTFGVRLNTGFRAIYALDMFMGIPGTYKLVATDDGSMTAVDLSGISHVITSIDTGSGLFSTNTLGEVAVKLKLAISAGLGKQSIIATADPALGYVLETWGQSGVSTYTATNGGPARSITDFHLARPEQGVFSRGQCLARSSTATNGLNFAFKVSSPGANQAIILAQ